MSHLINQNQILTLDQLPQTINLGPNNEVIWNKVGDDLTEKYKIRAVMYTIKPILSESSIKLNFNETIIEVKINGFGREHKVIISRYPSGKITPQMIEEYLMRALEFAKENLFFIGFLRIPPDELKDSKQEPKVDFTLITENFQKLNKEIAMKFAEGIYLAPYVQILNFESFKAQQQLAMMRKTLPTEGVGSLQAALDLVSKVAVEIDTKAAIDLATNSAQIAIQKALQDGAKSDLIKVRAQGAAQDAVDIMTAKSIELQ